MNGNAEASRERRTIPMFGREYVQGALGTAVMSDEDKRLILEEWGERRPNLLELSWRARELYREYGPANAQEHILSEFRIVEQKRRLRYISFLTSLFSSWKEGAPIVPRPPDNAA